jgi:deoxyadenosine/deoxycytidine kinase
LDNIQKQYLLFIQQHPALRTIIIDTAHIDFVHNEEHYNQLKSLIEAEYPLGVTRLSLAL